jgi:hypothetical protein
MFPTLFRIAGGALGATIRFLGTYLGGIVVGVALTGVLSFFLGRYERSRLVATQDAALARKDATYAEERARAATSARDAYSSALRLIEDRQRAIDLSMLAIETHLADINPSLERERARLRSTLETYAHDAKFDCRRLALPEPLLERLRRTGEATRAAPGAAGGGRDAALRAAPGGVPLDPRDRTSAGHDE